MPSSLAAKSWEIPLVYLLNGAHVTRAVLIKKRGETPTLIVGPMDRGSAAQAGYPVVLTTRYEYNALLDAWR